MAELKARLPREAASASTQTLESDDRRILDDSPISGQPYRLGDVFDLYDTGTTVKFKVSEIVERDGRRITYGTPV